MGDVDRDPSERAPRAPFVALAVTGAIVLGVRIRLLDLPFERDEGGYTYTAQLWLDGVLPYVGAYGVKMPGIFAAYAAILAVFPDTPRGVHTALALANAATAALLFGLARRLLGSGPAAVATALFLLLSLSYGVQGAFANAEHFAVLLAVGGLWGIHRCADPGRRAPVGALWAGVLLGCAPLVKQHAVAFTAVGGAWLAWSALRERPRDPRALLPVGAFGAGVALPFVAVGVLYASAGAFDDLWFWTVEYARSYAAPKPADRALANLVSGGGFALAAVAGLFALCAVGPLVLLRDPLRRPAPFLLLWLAGSMLAVVPGFVFRPHYFQFVLPVLAVLGAVTLCALHDGVRRRAGRAAAASAVAAVSVLALGQFVWNQHRYLWTLPPGEIVEIAYPGNPFRQSPAIAEIVRAHSRPDDTVAILGSEPQIYVYADRRAATGFLYMYALMEDHPWAAEMQRRAIAEIESSSPAVLVFVRSRLSWLQRADSHPELFRWLETYVQGFEPVERIPLPRPGDAVEIWRRRSPAGDQGEVPGTGDQPPPSAL
ncbi:MAG: ArnT family glycosyltransferase [Myxococcota bacterium]